MTVTQLPARYAVHRPKDVLPDPSEVWGVVALDSETSGLYTDDGARTCVVSVAYRRGGPEGPIESWAFPFDQGRAAEKGFEPLRLKSGILKAPVDLEEWERDVNLRRKDWARLLLWLQAAGATHGFATQNGKFDYHMLRVGTRHWPGVDLARFQRWDTQLVSKVLWPLENTSLKPTAARLWGEQEAAEADEVKKALADCKRLYGLTVEHGPRYDLIPWDVIGPYAAQDTVLTLRLAELQNQLLEEGEGHQGSWRVALQQIELGKALYSMERRAFGPYDVETSREVARRISDRIAELEPTFPFQPPTPIRAADYFYDELGLAPWKPGEDRRGFEVKKQGQHSRFVSGKRDQRDEIAARFPGWTVTWKQGSLTADIAARMGAAGAPHATDYAEYLRLSVANRMFYANYVELAGPDNRLRTSFRQAQVKSGRMSVERFQAQALPKKLGLTLGGEPLPEPKKLFLVPEGKRRYNLDLSQAELRIASELAQCYQMAVPLREGQDLHGQTCTRIFGKTPDHPDWKILRDVAKRLNFGGIFMIGARAFQANLWLQGRIEWPLARCQEATDGFKRTYPEIVAAYENWQSHVQQHGYVRLADGQLSWFGKTDWPNTAWNRVVQGSLAAWVADWIVMVERMTAEYEALVLTVHDSCVLDLPEDAALEVTAAVKEASEKLWVERFGFPGRVDVEEWGS